MTPRASFSGFTVGTFAHISLNAPVQSSPMESRSNLLIGSADTLMASFQTRMIVMQKILLQRLRDHQPHQTITIF